VFQIRLTTPTNTILNLAWTKQKLINEAKGQITKLVFNVGKKLCFKSREISSNVKPSLKPKAAKKN